MKNYIISYDILCSKRAYKVRKLVYSYSLGGQKSVLEIPLNSRDLKELTKELKLLVNDEDSVNIIEIKNDVISFGKADILTYNKGVLIV